MLGRTRWRGHRTAAGLFALLVFAYLWPALLEGRVFAPLAKLFAFTPWQASAPAGFAQYAGANLTDVPVSYYPWDVLARQLIHAGTFPAWNPHAFAGTPFFANPEVAWLSPFSLPLWILPLNYGLGVAAALKLWVAGFGTYLLVRELELGFWPAMLAGISFALCAFNMAWLAHGVFTSVAAMLPWAIWCVERIVRRGGAGVGLGLALVVAVLLTGGHPGTQLHVVTATILYALARATLSSDVAVRDRLLRLGLIAGALAVGALLAAVTLLPAERAAIGTAGAAARASHATGLHGANLPIGILRTALFPEWWGRTSELIAGPANYNERTLYAGVVALVLAVGALVSPDGWRRKAPFVLLGAIGLAVAPRGTGLHSLVNELPLFDRVQNQRMVLWFEFAVVILAAFGLRAVLDAPRRQGRIWGVLAGAALAAGVALVSLRLDAHTLGSALRHLADRTSGATSSVLALAAIGRWLIFVVALAGILLVARHRPERRSLVGALVALVAALDLLHFAHGYHPMGPASQTVPPRTPAIAFLQRHTGGGGRIAGFGFALANDWSSVYGLRDARGYDAPQPSVRFHGLWQLIQPGQARAGSYTISGVTPSGIGILGMLGTRYIVADAGSTSGSPLLPVAYRGRDATIFADALAVPRAIVPARVHVASGDEDELVTLAQNGFDPRRDAVVRSDEAGAAAPSAGGGRARVVDEQNASVTLRATLPHAGLVVLDDAWAPGWSVRVDGRSGRALQADVVLRGVVVPAGSHEVVWSYRVPGLRLGAALSAVGLLATFAWAGWLAVAARRRRQGARAAG